MSHNVIECIFQGEKQTRLYMIFLCVLLLRNEVYVFQSDWPHVHINFHLPTIVCISKYRLSW